MSKISVIGSGFSGLSAASFAAKHGHEVTVFEKNTTTGGRARAFSEDGFMFDMGPSWYWMPDTFERYFNAFGRSTEDYYKLVQLDPGFQMIFGADNIVQIPAKMNDIYDVFESIEKGSAAKLRKFLAGGRYKYDIGMRHLVYQPSFSWLEFAKYDVLKGVTQLDVLRSVSTHVRSYFKDERLVALMEFPVLFLGAMPRQIPALYSLMNYAALELGTWYPMGGMTEIIKGMEQLAIKLGVTIETANSVRKINTSGDTAISLTTDKTTFTTSGIIATGDYHHIEQHLLSDDCRNYDEVYWDKRTMAPSSLIFYVGVNKKISKLIHHNLFFDSSLDTHAREIYERPQWPADPLFYVCCPSKTDPSVAPPGSENLFILIPIAPGLADTNAIREKYFSMVISRMEKLCGEEIESHIVYCKSYCINDFTQDYNAYKGNAYGLANTLRQTAVLKPSMRNKKIKNLFYAGQLTVPGPGVPPALISGQVAAEQLTKQLKSTRS